MANVENEFSEGIALGVLMCGRDGIPHDKVNFELAFSGAWRRWQHQSKYPFVGGPTKKDEIYQMTHAGERHHVNYLYWDGLNIQARGNSDLDAETIAHAIHQGIPASAWHELVEMTFKFYEDPRARMEKFRS